MATIRVRLVALVAVTLGASILGLLLPAYAGPSTPTGHLSARTVDDGSHSYWTEARMAAAQPVAVVEPGQPQAAARTTTMASVTPVTVEPYVPKHLVSSPYKLVRSPKSFGGGLEFSRALVSGATAYPSSTHGKLFFRGPDGHDYQCSGTVVSSPDRNLVATAGHCLYDSYAGGFATKVIFVPAYRRGLAPFGEWSAKTLHVTDRWATKGDLRYDFALAEMRKDDSGRHLADVVGSRGLAFNAISSQPIDAYGYPAASPFNGQTSQLCESSSSVRDGSGLVAPIGIGCDMTEGSSGGGWIAGGYLSSVVSYGYVGIPDRLYGPYLGSIAEELYAGVVGDITFTQKAQGLKDSRVHATDLSLKLAGKLWAKGKVTPTDGSRRCSGGVPVDIYRMVDSDTARLVKARKARAGGRYTVKLPERNGRYMAYSPAGWVNSVHMCTGALSPLERYRK